MKQPKLTVLPLMDHAREKFSLRKLLLGHMSSDSYYEAHRDDNGVYILWMECSRFGQYYAYPCVLEADGETMVFLSGDAEGNRALLDRWRELVAPEEFAHFRSETLSRDNFYRIYGAYKRGEK